MICCPHKVSDVAVVPALSNLRDVALQETKVGAALSSCHLVTLSPCHLVNFVFSLFLFTNIFFFSLIIYIISSSSSALSCR